MVLAMVYIVIIIKKAKIFEFLNRIEQVASEGKLVLIVPKLYYFCFTNVDVGRADMCPNLF